MWDKFVANEHENLFIPITDSMFFIFHFLKFKLYLKQI